MVSMPAPVPHPVDPRFVADILPYQSLLLGMARRLCRQGGIDPEDLVQDTLERALRQHAMLAQRGERSRRAWLCTTLYRRFLDLCRRQRTETRDGPELTVVQAPVVFHEPRAWRPWEHVTDAQLHAALGHLKPPLRAVFELHALGLRYKAIAQELGTPLGTVSCWLFQARRDLRELLRPLASEESELPAV